MRVADATTVWRRAEGVLSRRTPRAVVLLVPGAPEPHRADGAAVAVWEALDVARTDAELTELVAARHGARPDDVRAHVVGARTALVGLGAVAGTDG